MGRFRTRDLFLVPGLLSLARVPLAAAFPFVVHVPAAALAVIAAGALTDVLDGWLARRLDQVTPTGAVVDGITDKLFVGSIAVTLVASGLVDLPTAVLLATREVGELPLVLWLALSRKARRLQASDSTANAYGKITTALQLAVVGAVLLGSPHVRALAMITAIAGIVAAAAYWQRVLRRLASGPRSVQRLSKH